MNGTWCASASCASVTRLMPRHQIWCRSARPWLAELGGIPRNATQ